MLAIANQTAGPDRLIFLGTYEKTRGNIGYKKLDFFSKIEFFKDQNFLFSKITSKLHGHFS